MERNDIEARIKQAAEHAVINFISQGQWLQPDWTSRLKVPPEIISQAWALVDREKLLVALKARIENELADRLINHIAAEISTDIKQILSVKERREAIRALAREHMEGIMQAGVAP